MSTIGRRSRVQPTNQPTLYFVPILRFGKSTCLNNVANPRFRLPRNIQTKQSYKQKPTKVLHKSQQQGRLRPVFRSDCAQFFGTTAPVFRLPRSGQTTPSDTQKPTAGATAARVLGRQGPVFRGDCARSSTTAKHPDEAALRTEATERANFSPLTANH